MLQKRRAYSALDGVFDQTNSKKPVEVSRPRTIKMVCAGNSTINEPYRVKQITYRSRCNEPISGLLERGSGGLGNLEENTHRMHVVVRGAHLRKLNHGDAEGPDVSLKLLAWEENIICVCLGRGKLM